MKLLPYFLERIAGLGDVGVADDGKKIRCLAPCCDYALPV